MPADAGSRRHPRAEQCTKILPPGVLCSRHHHQALTGLPIFYMLQSEGVEGAPLKFSKREWPGRCSFRVAGRAIFSIGHPALGVGWR